eukprot:TRINITY_DN44746_c0_g1_i1.p1 TRINITY_DN44746_c0_g1~~TRINITY_DN44746_c0_g1_i1.p1  ORF type:complete len:380 (-),score=58.87 TRINITY_DN44746_c0_g1_i1:49-1188(-)
MAAYRSLSLAELLIMKEEEERMHELTTLSERSAADDDSSETDSRISDGKLTESGISEGKLVQSGLLTHGLPRHHEPSQSLPADLYGASMGQLICFAAASDQAMNMVVVSIVFYLLASILIQVALLYTVSVYVSGPAVSEIQQLGQEFDARVFVNNTFSSQRWDDFEMKRLLCENPWVHSSHVIILVLFIWTMEMAIEVNDTLLAFATWFQLPDCSDSSCGVILESEASTAGAEIRVRKASWRLKCLICTIALAPKVAISLALWWIGSVWLAASSTVMGQIQNAMMLNFIGKMDGMLYEWVVPRHSKTWFARFRIDVVTMTGSPQCRLQKIMMLMLGRLFGLALLPGLCLFLFQQAMPRNLVARAQGPCSSWLEQNAVKW